ncbi:AraC family transcriptional regulator [Domibacillus enclensis]|uniref:AraC family transcriptional regulator n=1 Tax=Domibacillus enclensis TaxID=1017273 RepID=A0A1N6RG42_9BACI|nr:AraC family transcriptional regulator [Domibacillus enclensis]OXS79051.1 AraC family transcriptional regulator [Domibacillus enclensis]SIQ27814.1 AraC-type DNA-binding protein [Domibacillus enclensis]
MSDTFPLSSAVMTLFQLTHLNIFALDPSGRLLMLHAPHDIPDRLNEDAFQSLSAAVIEQPAVCHFWHDEPFAYIGGYYDAGTVLAAGPFLTQMPDPSATHLNQQTMRGLPILNRATRQSIANVLMHLNKMEPVTLSSINGGSAPSDSPYSADETAAASLINLRYAVSNEMMQAIEDGDAAALVSVTKKADSLFDFSNRFPNKPLRVAKNSLIILNTTFRLAAERGGAPPVLLHQLSEKFAIAIERLNSLHTLDQLQESMGDEYCQLVAENKLAGYSMLIKETIRYLHIHYAEPFDAAALAQSLHIHPSHLARQFKKETGTTMVQYVHSLRVQEAKRLLKKDTASIEYIAGQCGFDDAAYFARVFKKVAGISPGSWRKQ